MWASSGVGSVTQPRSDGNVGCLPIVGSSVVPDSAETQSISRTRLSGSEDAVISEVVRIVFLCYGSISLWSLFKTNLRQKRFSSRLRDVAPNTGNGGVSCLIQVIGISEIVLLRGFRGGT